VNKTNNPLLDHRHALGNVIKHATAGFINRSTDRDSVSPLVGGTMAFYHDAAQSQQRCAIILPRIDTAFECIDHGPCYQACDA